MTAKETYQLLRSKRASCDEQSLNQLQVYTKGQVAMDYSTDIRELSASNGKLSGTGGIRTFITGRDKLTYDFIDLDQYYVKDEVDELLEEEKNEREEADNNLQEQITDEVERAKESEDNLQNSINDEIDRAKDAEDGLQKSIDAITDSYVKSVQITSNTLDITPTTSQNGDVSINVEYIEEPIDLSGYVQKVDLCDTESNDWTYLVQSILGFEANDSNNVTITVVEDHGQLLDSGLWGLIYTISGNVDLSSKQDVLVAGAGLDITDNVISCTLDNTVFKIVEELPTSDIDTDVIYVVTGEVTGGNNNLYSEYIYVNGQWEKLGEFQADVDLSNYYTKDETYTRDEIKTLITQAQLDPGEVDLSNYYTKSEVDSKLSDYAKIEDLSGKYVLTIMGTPPETDEYTYDTNLAFVAIDASETPQPPDGTVIQGVTYQIGAYVYLPGYYTKTEVDELIENAAIGDVDLTDYVKIGDVCPRNVDRAESYLISSLSSTTDETHNVEFNFYVSNTPPPPCDEDEECTPILWAKDYVISANVDLSNYYTQDEVRELIALAQLDGGDVDLSDYVKKTDISGKVVTSLTAQNDDNVTITITTTPPSPESDTIDGIDYCISAKVDLADYYTKEQVDDLLSETSGGTTYEYYTENSVDSSGFPSAQISCTSGHSVARLQVLANALSSSNTYILATAGASSANTVKLDYSGFYYNDCEVATQCWVQELVDEKVTGGTVDLSNYYTKSDIDSMFDDIKINYYTETGNSATIETPDVNYGTISTTWTGGNANTMTITTSNGSTVMHGNYIHVTGSNGSSGLITIDGNKVLTDIDLDVAALSGLDIDKIDSCIDDYTYNNTISTSLTSTSAKLHIITVNGSGSSTTFSIRASNLAAGREMHWIIQNTGTGTHTYNFGASSNYNHVCVDGNTSLTIQPGEYGEISMISDGTYGYIRSTSQS